MTSSFASGLFFALETHAQKLGIFPGGVNLHEADSPPTAPACSFWLGPIQPYAQGSGLNATTARITVLARIFTSRMQRPLDAIEPAVLDATTVLLGEYNANFTLGGLIRSVDLMNVRAAPAYLTWGEFPLRVVEITLPLVVNDLWAQEA